MVRVFGRLKIDTNLAKNILFLLCMSGMRARLRARVALALAGLAASAAASYGRLGAVRHRLPAASSFVVVPPLPGSLRPAHRTRDQEQACMVPRGTGTSAARLFHSTYRYGAGGLRHGVAGLACSDGPESEGNTFLSRWRSALAVTGAAMLLGTTAFAPSGEILPQKFVQAIVGQTQASSAFVDVEASDRRLEPSEKNTIRLFRDNTPSVVFINTFVDRQDRLSLDIEQVPQGSGSGFVWDTQGHIGKRFLRALPPRFLRAQRS